MVKAGKKRSAARAEMKRRPRLKAPTREAWRKAFEEWRTASENPGARLSQEAVERLPDTARIDRAIANMSGITGSPLPAADQPSTTATPAPAGQPSAPAPATAPTEPAPADAGYQRERTKRALRELYKPDGKTGLPTARVQKAVASHLRDESLALGISGPSWHTVNRALGRE